MNRRGAVDLAILAMMLCGLVRAEPTTMPDGAATPAKGVKVSIEAVSETRDADLFPPGQVDLKAGIPNRVLIQLKFQGDSVKNMSQIGPAMVYEARDDLNESLVENPPEATQPSKSEMGTVMEGVETDDAARFGRSFFALRSPARRATKIVRLRGAFPVMAGGDRKTIEFTDLPSRFGKFLDDPTLTKAGVKVWIDAKKEKGANDFTDLLFKLSGNLSAVRQVKVFDGNTELSTGAWYSTQDPKPIPIGRAITKQTVLRLFVVVNEKRVTVPFEFSNVPLP